MTFNPECMATGVGSMPFTEPEKALSLIFKGLPKIPHWPQLPMRGNEEGFVYQVLNPLVEKGLLVVENNKAYFNTSSANWSEKMTDFYSTYLEAEQGNNEALDQFAIPKSSATGFYAFINRLKEKGTGSARYLKGQMAGPLTVGFQLKDAEGRICYYEEQLRDILVKALSMHARWQARVLSQFGLPVIFFFDEPAISMYGKGTHITITRDMIKKDINAIAKSVHSEGGYAGLHSCDAIDWSILFESNLEIVNLDCYNFGMSLLPTVQELKDFLNKGGILAWGITPTSVESFEETAETLLARLDEIWRELQKRDIDRDLIKQQCLITPACGTGTLEAELSEQIYRLTREVSEKLMGS
ncbi:MAG: hypothetical protein K9L17_01525 [Clostridiales bacterium]|nr:hypothetical protein [Clostridiales bacterium]MCF8021372.1 hypothetical protein [Clostridiales bacterium]